MLVLALSEPLQNVGATVSHAPGRDANEPGPATFMPGDFDELPRDTQPIGQLDRVQKVVLRAGGGIRLRQIGGSLVEMMFNRRRRRGCWLRSGYFF